MFAGCLRSPPPVSHRPDLLCGCGRWESTKLIMDYFKIMFLICTLYVLGVFIHCGAGQKDVPKEQKPGTLFKAGARALAERKLRETLLDKYDKSIMPNSNNSQLFLLRMAMILTGVPELDVRNQRMHISAWMKMEWWDGRLTWNGTANADLSTLPLNQEDIYVPEIHLLNQYRARNVNWMGSTMALAYFHGEVIWLPPVSLEVPCSMDVSNWPYDEHECVFIFGHASRDNTTFEIRTESDDVALDNFFIPIEWSVVNTRATRFQYYSGVGDGYDNIRFNITVRRIPHGYLRSLFFVPHILLLASLLIFWISDKHVRALYATFQLIACLALGVGTWCLVPPSRKAPNIVYLSAGCPSLILSALLITFLLDFLNSCTREIPSRLITGVQKLSFWSTNENANPFRETCVPLRDAQAPTDHRGCKNWTLLADFLRVLLFVVYFLCCCLLALLTVVLKRSV